MSSDGKIKPPAGVPRFEPDIFGKYYLLQRIGIGGMAEVIRAKMLGAGGFEKELVIKRVLQKFSRDEAFVRMFVNEAKIGVGLGHPNIAQILELGEFNNTFFMAIELIDGVDLAQLAPLIRPEKGILTIEEAVWLVFETLKGLDYAHRKVDTFGRPLEIVHCDISPDNVMVTFDAAVKILDFGIARIASNLSNKREGMVMGKVNFLSPEQALGRDVDHKSDLYSTGIMLYYLVTGDYPYGKFKTLKELAPLVTGSAKYTPAFRKDERVSKELDAVIKKAVSLKPKDRYADARAFQLALEEILHPTPHSTIAENVRKKIAESFSEKKERLARLRANDAAVMRILARRLEANPEKYERKSTSEHIALAPPPSEAGQPAKDVQTVGKAPKRKRIELPWWYVSPVQVFLALIFAVGMGFAFDTARTSFFPVGVLIIDSDPQGAHVFIDDSPLPGLTPMAVDEIMARKSYNIRIDKDNYAPWEGSTPGNGDKIQRIFSSLQLRYGTIEISSRPRGTRILINDQSRGITPLRLENADLIGPMKISFIRPGFEPYEKIVRNLDDGQVIHHDFDMQTESR